MKGNEEGKKTLYERECKQMKKQRADMFKKKKKKDVEEEKI